MPLKTVKPVKDSSNKLFLEAGIIENIELGEITTVPLHLGSFSTDVQVTANDEGNFISSSVLNALGVPEINGYHLKYESKRGFSLGPVIGIMISINQKRRYPPYTSQKFLLKKFLTYCQKQNYFGFVFSPEGVDQENAQITGYYLKPDKTGTLKWKKHVFPLPDVIFDRILHRFYEKKALTSRVKDYLIKVKGIPYFNPKFLNKWETHQILEKDAEVSTHLPETTALKDIRVLQRFLTKHNTVYIKPVHGSLGVGIFKITRTPRDYICEHRKNKQHQIDRFSTLKELETAVKAHVANKNYIIQQGLNMLKYHDRVFDIRVLMQKNAEGIWDCTAIVGRLAPDGGLFPNIAAGGEAKNMSKLWPELKKEDWASSETRKAIIKTGIKAAKVLEKSLGTFGEIGLDIGLDAKGNVWIVEINSKPSRKVFPKDQLHLKTKSIHLPMDFAAFLTGFNHLSERHDKQSN